MPKITKLETFTTEFVAFVKVTDEEGQTGWGQTSTYNADITTQVFYRQVAPYALGSEADNIAALITRIERREHKFPGSYRCRALAGLDTALWDLKGKRAGKSVAELLGGTPGPLRAYASSMRRDISPKDEAERLKRCVGEQGFDAVKFRVGSECGADVDEWPGRTEEIIPTVARAVGDDIAKLVDANSGFSVKRAIEVGNILQDNGIEHFEEPTPYWDLDMTREVTAALDVAVTGGEQDWDLNIWKLMIDTKVVDVVQPDIMYMGGIARTLMVAEMAAKAGMTCTPHAANWSLVTMATMHLLKAIPNAGKYLEFSIEDESYYPWQTGLFLGNPYRIENGCAIVPDAPGFGIDVNPEWLLKSDYRQANVDDFQPSAYHQLYGGTHVP